MGQALVACGANLGQPEAQIARALELLAAQSGLHVQRTSHFYRTQPVGGPLGQPSYVNGAVLLETALEPQALWGRLSDIESQLGRQRDERWGPRTLDLDLLLVDELVIDTPRLVVPHPRLAVRRFVLEPAAEIAPQMRHPTIGWTLAKLLEHLRTAANRLAIVGADADLCRRLAGELESAALGWQIECRSADERSDRKLTVEIDDPTAAGAAVRAAVERPGQGPWLRLDPADWARLVAEVMAALRGMA